MSSAKFLPALAVELMDAMTHWYGSDNWDSERFGPFEASLKSSVVTKLNSWLARSGSVVPRLGRSERLVLETRMERMHDGFAEVYESLADDESKNTFVKVLAYRLLGFRRVKLPLNNPDYWQQRDVLTSLQSSGETVESGLPGIVLRRMGLESVGWPLELYSTPAAVMATFILRQYSYGKSIPPIGAGAGECVIDAGGCWGDTALFFAQQVGETGRVYTFEFTPENLTILDRNVALNAAFNGRINVVREALWDRSNMTLSFEPRGPATVARPADLIPVPTGNKARTTSLDDFVDGNALSHVDFIKMDIEGAELNALRGAEQTLRKFRPDLAIAVYHRDEDFVTIPQFLCQLGIGYRFFLHHFTIFEEETILFATAAAT
jgi:FkbM family methyltransferase